MFQLTLALIFVGMILTPAIVAARSGKKETDSETAPEAQPFAHANAKKQQEESTAPRSVATVQAQAASTLPLHGTLGLSGR